MDGSSSEDENLMPQVFQVIDTGVPITKTPTSANEYLTSVRAEARNLGKIVNSKRISQDKAENYKSKQTTYLPVSIVRNYFKSGSYKRIPQEWKESSLDKFKKLKTEIDVLREGLMSENFDFEKNISLNVLTGICPKLSTTLKPNYTQLSQISEIIVQNSIPYIKHLLNNTTLNLSLDLITYEFNLWFFSFLLLLNKPLLPETSNDLNSILEIYITQEEKALEFNNIEILAMIRSIIIIIAEYFGQRIS